MRLTSAMLFLACNLGSSAATSQTATRASAATETNSPAQAASSDRKICVEEQATGSLFPRKACLTAAQWKAQKADKRKRLPPSSTILGQDMVRMPDPK